jgi:integrating conjugative element protein (TIGR03755 family)
MKILDKKIVVPAVLLATSMSVFADNMRFSPRLSEAMGFQLGGGYTGAPPTTVHTVPVLDLGIGWDMNMECGKFDPKISVSAQLNGITDGFRNMMDNIISSATGAVAQLPALAIQKANPALYDMLQQGILQGKLDFEWAETSCDQMANVMMGNESFPFENYKMGIKANNWSAEIGGSGGDAIAAKQALDSTNHGDAGAEWICGDKKGGSGQQPINALKDVVIVGYNIMYDRANTCTTGSVSAAVGGNTPLYSYWTSPVAAAEWAERVIGDTQIRTCDGCTKIEGIAGKGLTYMHRDMTEQLYTRIEDLVTGATPLTWQNLNLVSAPPGVEITQTIILSIRKRSPAGQAEMIERLSGEIAQARIVEQGRLLTQMLRTGAKEPNVSAFDPAKIVINEAIDHLQVELDQLDLETRTRKNVAKDTILKIIGMEEKKIQSVRNDQTGKSSGTNVLGAP